MSITKTKIALYTLAPLGIALGATGFALADSKSCQVSQDAWQSQDAALQFAKDQGWSVQEIDMDDGCYELEGVTAEGQRFEAKLDPAKLTIIKMEHEDDDERRGYGFSAHNSDNDDDGRGYGEREDHDDDDDDDAAAMANPAPSGTVAPPQNGLFNNGTAPKVELN